MLSTLAPMEGLFADPISVELAGDLLPSAPDFHYVRTFHEAEPIWVGLDPFEHAELVGRTVDLWIVRSRNADGWRANATLTDVRGGPQTVTIAGGGLTQNLWLANSGTLPGLSRNGFGYGYDVVLDINQNGRLDPRDRIDGFGDEAGFYVVPDSTEPGPYATSEVTYSGGAFLGQITYFPSEIAELGLLPLVVISHGNGHMFTWYHHIGRHLASHGYIVMSHQNNTQPGVGAASTTTLTNTDYLLANLDTIAGGALQGHVDSAHMAWVGHSRGGEGVVRAWKRVQDGLYTPTHFTAADVKFLCSIAPVTFLASTASTPEKVPFHLFYGAADDDVKGTPASCCKPAAFYERAQGPKSHVYVQGLGHAYFHNGNTGCFCKGPDLITKSEAHELTQGYLLPLVAYWLRREPAARDFWERSYEEFQPPGLDPATVIAKEFRFPDGPDRFVIDDFQTNPDPAVSSSNGQVTMDVANWTEGQLEDFVGFVWDGTEPMNGMTRTVDSLEDYAGGVFDWDASGPRFLEFEIVPAERDLTQRDWVMFRVAQGTRHPENEAWDGPITFTVTLRDTAGFSGSIDVGAHGGVTRTYQRGGSTPPGWANEFVTFRLRLADFARDGNGLDLTSIEALRFEFGPGFGSTSGRLGIDDIELVRDGAGS